MSHPCTARRAAQPGHGPGGRAVGSAAARTCSTWHDGRAQQTSTGGKTRLCIQCGAQFTIPSFRSIGGGLREKLGRNEAQFHVRPPQDVSGASRGVRHGEQLLSGAPPPPTATAHESTTSTEDTCVEPVERFGRRPYCHRPQLLGSGSGGGQKLGRHVLQPARQALHGAHQPRVGRGQVLEP